MPRPVKYDESVILRAAASIVADRGPAAATIGAIGGAIGAPSGSIYHRFRTRDELLGRLWLAKAAFFQGRFAEGLAHPDPYQAGLNGALSLPRAVRQDFEGARIMLLHRREDFLSDSWPPEMAKEARRLGEQVRELLSEITRRLMDKENEANRQLVVFAVLDIPFAAVRRNVAMGKLPPKGAEGLITRAYEAIMADRKR
ncbi:MAG: TetR family transcriptional regulator [Sphingosinicella sp.]|nr:TetR family transcriptional regulator [Sphingosinicella sp.]